MQRLIRSVALIAATTLGFAVLPPTTAADAELPLRVTVQGEPHLVPEGTTVGEMLASLEMAPDKGDLISVKKRVLRANVVSGLILIDGKPVASSELLFEGAKVTLKPGPNVREPVTRTLTPSVAVRGNPIRTIPASYGVSIVVVRGLISGETIEERPAGQHGAAVALTFDDGPDPNWTPRVLAVLSRYKVKATFFTTGRNTARYPHLIRAIRAGGHTVQNHSWNHENLARLTPAAQWRSLISHIRSMRAQGLVAPTWFRPPYGSYTPTTVQLASKLGMRTAIWSADASDYKRPPASVIMRRTISQIGPGGVILLHDAGGNRANTVGALPGIIETLLRRGYRFVALS